MDFQIPNVSAPLLDALVQLTGVVRLVLITLVFALNCCALFRVCFRSRLCMHNTLTTAVILANLIYLVTWPPFIVYSLSNGAWTLLNEQVYCLSQNYVVNAMGMVMVSLLAVRLSDRARQTVFGQPPLTNVQNAAVAFFMWLLPQLLYDLVSLTGSRRLCGRSPVFRFLGDIVHLTPTDAHAGYALGFMVCQQRLTAAALGVHVWQYLVIVLPMAAVVAVAAVLLLAVKARRRRGPWTTEPLEFRGVDGHVPCRLSCQRRMVVVDLILCSNLFWHLIGRPLMLLHALFYGEQALLPAAFLDVGSHVMLAISCVFIPTVCAKLVMYKRDDHVDRKWPLAGAALVRMDCDKVGHQDGSDRKMLDIERMEKIPL